MLKHLKKYFTTQVETPASADTQEEDNQMVTETLNAEMEAKLAEVTTSFTTLQASFDELTAKYETVQAALAASADAQKALVEQAAAKRLEARTAAITEAVGTAKLEDTLAATDSLSDEQFSTILGVMAKSFDKEAEGKMFNEAGVAAEAPAVEVDAVQKLAAKFAAEFATK